MGRGGGGIPGCPPLRVKFYVHVHVHVVVMQANGERVAVKVFSGSTEFKSLKREIDVVRSLPTHDNIVTLFGVEEEVCGNLVPYNQLFMRA